MAGIFNSGWLQLAAILCGAVLLSKSLGGNAVLWTDEVIFVLVIVGLLYSGGLGLWSKHSIASFLRSGWLHVVAVPLWTVATTVTFWGGSSNSFFTVLPFGILYTVTHGIWVIVVLAVCEQQSTMRFRGVMAVVGFCTFVCCAAVAIFLFGLLMLPEAGRQMLLTFELVEVFLGGIVAVFLAYLARSVSRNLLT